LQTALVELCWTFNQIFLKH